MLQQTTVTAVIPYFQKFTERWPDILALAAADQADVMAAWAGLGYYSRARNLVACAREVAARGNFPECESELRKLPGLGAYTAAAMAAIAFGKRAIVIDANIERVIARLFAISEALPGARKEIRIGAEAITPAERAGDFAQAMMDLGAAICTPRGPRCGICPLARQCAGRDSGHPERFPIKPSRKSRPQRAGRAYWIERAGSVWLVYRPPGGMLGGMRALPDDGWSVRANGSNTPPLDGPWESAGAVQHGFTHFSLKLSLGIYQGTDWQTIEHEGGQWWPIDQLDQAGLPTVFAKVARLALAREDQP